MTVPGPGDPLPRPDARPRRVGLLGGSFNPAHDGHLHISRLALDRLGLDEVWWLVAPQNPLKSTAGMAPLAERHETAGQTAADPQIRVSGIEAEFGTHYTADTLERLLRHWPSFRFVWLMGADILIQMPDWQHWQWIFESVPIAVFARPPYSARALESKAAQQFAHGRLPETEARRLADADPPAWVFLMTPDHPGSATRIRERRRRAEGSTPAPKVGC